MANMGYCRFRNTLEDLRDCYDHMDDENLSVEEKRARVRIIGLAKNIVDDFGDEAED